MKIATSQLMNIFLVIGAVILSIIAFIAFSKMPKESDASITYPMDLIGSKNWKLTLPIDDGKEIKISSSPSLKTYADEWFYLNEAANGVVFKVRTDGETTSGSNNPRSELREMKNDGKDNASWSSTSGNHSMIIEQSVDILPIGDKPVVVAGQIHDSDDDVTVFRIESNKYGGNTGDGNLNSIWITDGDTTHGYLVTNSYALGHKFSIGFKVSNGKINYVYNGADLPYVKNKTFSGAYFKAGAYNQSGDNCTKLTDGPDAGECDFAQVTIYGLQVCHNGTCTGNGAGTSGEVSETENTTESEVTEPEQIVITDDAFDERFASLKVGDYKKPTNLKWSAVAGGIKLSWKAAPGEDDAEIIGYKIYEKTSSSDYKYVLISTNTDATVQKPAGSYSYKVSAVYQNDEDSELGESKMPSAVSVVVK